MNFIKEIINDDDIRAIFREIFLSIATILAFAVSLKLVTALYQAFWFTVFIINLI